MLVAIRIWTKLKRSIPLGFGEYYSLIPDPTAGKVTVVARMPTLEIPGLWSINSTDARSTSPLLEKPGVYSQIHNSILAMGMPLAAPSTAMMARNATGNDVGPTSLPLRIGRQHLLRRTWMSLVDHCGLVLKNSHPDENGNDDDTSDGEETRFVVAGDLKASDRTPLKMNWPQFVWLALALGVSARDSGWRASHPCTLKKSECEDLIYLFYEEDRLFARLVPRAELTYSLQRAFAWYNIKLDGRLLSPLGYGKNAQVCLNSVTMSPELSASRRGMDLDPQGCSSTIRGREAQHCYWPFAAACYLMLYWRRRRLEFQELIAVSEDLLEYRQRVLCHLWLLDDRNELVAKLQSLVLAGGVEHVAAKPTPGTLVATFTTRESESALPQSGPSLDSVPKNEGTSGKQDVPLSTRNQSLVDEILEQVRSCFASSRYVQRHAEFHKQTTLIGAKLMFERASYYGSRRKLVRLREELGMLEPEWSFLGPQVRPSIKGKVGSDNYDLIPSTLKTELESRVHAWALDPHDRSGNVWDEGSGIGFVACVALALADWDHHGASTWQLQDRLRSMAEQVRDLVGEQFSESSIRKGAGNLGATDRLERALREASVDILEEGLFVAPPEDPVSRLLHLRKKDSTVYLL